MVNVSLYVSSNNSWIDICRDAVVSIVRGIVQLQYSTGVLVQF